MNSANSNACFGSHYHIIINLISERVTDHEFCLARAALPRKLVLDESPDPLRAKACKEGRAVIDVALEHTRLSRSQLEELLNPEKLTAGGV